MQYFSQILAYQDYRLVDILKHNSCTFALNSEIDADIFCVGSDQMWNSEYNGGVIEENFLGFAPKGKKKISFSTSMGMTAYNDPLKTLSFDLPSTYLYNL